MQKIWIFFILMIYCFILLLHAATAFSACDERTWNNVSSNIGDMDLAKITINTVNPSMVYASSSNALYETNDGGKTWKEILSFRGTDQKITSIEASSNNKQAVFCGTNGGLYVRKDRGLRWEKIFSDISNAGSTVLSILEGPPDTNKIIIGTRAGMFITEDNGKTWNKNRNVPSDIVVSSLIIDRTDPHILYAVTGRGIYKSVNSGIGWQRIYQSKQSQEKVDPTEDDEINNDIELTRVREMRSLVISPNNAQELYLGTSRGILISKDQGVTWMIAHEAGLLSRDIKHLAIDPDGGDHIYAATSKGAFCYSSDTDSWSELYKGMDSSDVRYLATTRHSSNETRFLWAVTKRGVYRSSTTRGGLTDYGDADNSVRGEKILSLFSHEPSIQEIREAAIIYAEVQPDKIEKWRKAASNRAWLPDLRVSYDETEDWQSSTYFYSTSSQKFKDDDITKGEDDGWSISLTWELGDLIWNDAQTSIDSRSRLMVQLRDDILNEVTRLYYERRRLQIEMAMSKVDDTALQLEKRLRLEELTANIDALTGSYLSKRLGQGS